MTRFSQRLGLYSPPYCKIDEIGKRATCEMSFAQCVKMENDITKFIEKNRSRRFSPATQNPYLEQIQG
jgi:hypothetical protein